MSYKALFRALTSDFSRVTGIVLSWAATLWFMFWADHSATSWSLANAPDWKRGFWGVVYCCVLCLFILIVGYTRLLEERPATKRFVPRLVIMCRAFLFLFPIVAFTCAFFVCAFMYIGLFPYQGEGYSALYTASLFSFHYYLWMVPYLSDAMVSLDAVIVNTDGNTYALAQMCRVAAVVTLIGTGVPALYRRR